MRTNSASMASLLMAGSSATPWRIGIQLATTARSTCHFLSASNLMNFQAASGYLHDDEMLDAATWASVGAFGTAVGLGVANILPLRFGLSPTTLATDQ